VPRTERPPRIDLPAVHVVPGRVADGGIADEDPGEGFKSKKQWRLLFLRGEHSAAWKALAHTKAHATAGGKGVRYRRLPVRRKAAT